MKQITRQIRLVFTTIFVGILAQHAGAQNRPAHRNDAKLSIGGNAGLVIYETGDERNCPTGAGFGAGVELRSRGSWVLAGGADLLAAAPYVCTQVLAITTYQGQEVGVWSGARFPLAPRAGIRVGRTVRSLDASLRAGYILTKNDFFPKDIWLGRPILGGDVSWRRGRVGLQIVYERFRAPIRYIRIRDREVVHEFNVWKPMYRFGIVL